VLGHALQEFHIDEERGLEASTLRLLSVGAGAGAFARYVIASDLKEPRIEIDEQDCVLVETNALPVVNAGRHMRSDAHDIVTMVIPSPGLGGAANHRRIYRGERGRFFDLSAVGPRQWKSGVAVWLELMSKALSRTGTAYVLVPGSIRLERGYVRAPELLDSVLDQIRRQELVIVAQRSVLEVEPLPQPFVGRHRPVRTSLIVRFPV
jgi:hypothetical protein